jgi:hypothetical protein
MTERYHFEILSWTGGIFARSARPWSVDEIKADTALSTILRRYRHQARTEAGAEVEHLPDFPQPEPPAPAPDAPDAAGGA